MKTELDLSPLRDNTLHSNLLNLLITPPAAGFRRIGPPAFDKIIFPAIIPLLQRTGLNSLTPVVKVALPCNASKLDGLSEGELAAHALLQIFADGLEQTVRWNARSSKVASILYAIKRLSVNQHDDLMVSDFALGVPALNGSPQILLCPLMLTQALMQEASTPEGKTLRTTLERRIAAAVIDSILHIFVSEQDTFFRDDPADTLFPKLSQVKEFLMRLMLVDATLGEKDSALSLDAQRVLQNSVATLGWVKTLERLRERIGEGELSGSLNILKGLPGWNTKKFITRYSCGGSHWSEEV
jgi:hypothetical protein